MLIGGEPRAASGQILEAFNPATGELLARFPRGGAEDVDRAGSVWVNGSSRHFLGAPYGGVENSGVGREEGVEELESYAEPKNVNVRFG